MKQIISILLRWSALWTLPLNVVFAVIAAKEGVDDVFPRKTITACAAYAAFWIALLAGYFLL